VGFEAGRVGEDEVVFQVPGPAFGHLAAAGVAGAEEKQAESLHDPVPVVAAPGAAGAGLNFCRDLTIPFEKFQEGITVEPPQRARGQAVFMTGDPG